MSERRRDRRGRHESVAGDPALDTLRDLVQQFSDRFAFIRELIQNSLDADASSIAVEMSWADGLMSIAVRDDGEGMDRDIIEGYLLTLFRSTKEQDMTKIGKFGIGFVSLFAMQPREVVVDTGRDGVWHRVVFHEDRSYTLLRMEDPYEGTTVTLKVPGDDAAAALTFRRVREAAKRWCRFADADITLSAQGIPSPWGPARLAEPFTVDSPVTVEEEGDGHHAVMGLSAKGGAGFYNHGLTLWESDEALIPGVVFRVRGRHLEHTLTRDNVIRDRHFDAVMRRVQALAKGALGRAAHAALAEAAAAGDLARLDTIFDAMGPTLPFALEDDAPILPAVGGGTLSLGALRASMRRGLLSFVVSSRSAELLWGHAQDPLALAIAGPQRPVVAASGPESPTLARLAEWLGTAPVAVHTSFRMLVEVSPPPGWDALAREAERLARPLPGALRFVIARFVGDGEDAFSRKAPEPLLAPERYDSTQNPTAFGLMAINADHPLVGELLGLPAPVAAPLLVRAAVAGVGQRVPLREELVLALVEATLRGGAA